MKVFIPTNEANKSFVLKGFSFRPLVIEAYKYHLFIPTLENTQNLFNKKVKTGIVTTKTGNASDE